MAAQGPTTYVLKAVTARGGESVGYAIIRVVGEKNVSKGAEQGAEAEGSKEAAERDSTSGWEADADNVVNHDFCDVYLRRLKDNYERHMGGRDHACRCLVFLQSLLLGIVVSSWLTRFIDRRLEHLNGPPRLARPWHWFSNDSLGASKSASR